MRILFFCNERTLLLRLIGRLYTNPDNSHNKMLCKSFFEETHSMLEASERLVINNIKDEWSDLSHVGYDVDVINYILNHKIITHIAVYGIRNY